MIRIVFGLISALGLLMALGTVLARNLVHAALYLVAFFFLIACQFVLLEAEFLAAMQVLIYIGAVAILLMFGIMLTRNVSGDETTGGSWLRKIPAAAAALGVLAVLLVGIARESGIDEGKPGRWAVEIRPGADPRPEIKRNAGIANMGKSVGDELMTRYGLAFEVAGLLLTAALVGAVALAQGEGTGEGPPRRGTGSRRIAEAPTNGTAATPTTSGLTTAEALSTPRA